jgi:hypothetical protein
VRDELVRDDGGGQGFGVGGDRLQAREEPGLDDCDPRGKAHADAGFGGGHQEGQVLAGAELSGGEEGGDQSLPDLGYYDAVVLHGRYSGTRLFCDELKSKFLGRAQVEVCKGSLQN